jgi:fatty-acyl-CoA synthase
VTGFIPDLIAKRAELGPEAVAIDEYATGRVFTYAELDRRAAQAASVMAGAGIGEGDRVAILCRNRAAFFEILFGCAKLGAILVPLNWRMPVAELEGLITDAEPSLLFYGTGEAEVQAALSRPIRAIGLDEEYEALIAAAAPARARTLWPEDGIWYLLYTSGTTGKAKGVIYTYRMAVANAVNIGTAASLQPVDSTVCFLPLFHTAGINLHSLPALLGGSRVIILPGVDIDALVALFEQKRIDAFFAVPTVYQSLLDHPRFARAPLAHVGNWCSGGAPLPDEVAERFRRLGLRLCNGMGMTETGPTAFVMPPSCAWERMGSVGKPQILCAVRIIDAAGKDVADGQTGELLFAGPGVTPGYWRDPEATREAFTSDGWLRSGDLGYRDPHGFYHVVGRRKEMFISGGENVFPGEVENVLNAHPAVAEAAVIAAPDPHWGEVGHAFIRLSGTAPAPDFGELAAFCRTRLAAYKVPQRFTFVSEFPHGPAGKIQKHLLAG